MGIFTRKGKKEKEEKLLMLMSFIQLRDCTKQWKSELKEEEKNKREVLQFQRGIDKFSGKNVLVNITTSAFATYIVHTMLGSDLNKLINRYVFKMGHFMLRGGLYISFWVMSVY